MKQQSFPPVNLPPRPTSGSVSGSISGSISGPTSGSISGPTSGSVLRLVQKLVQQAGPPLIPLAMLTFLLEFLVRMHIVASFIIPAPSTVLETMYDSRLELLTGFVSTALTSLAGLLASLIIGTTVAILLSSSRFLKKAFYPYAIFFQTVPVIALAPLLVIWFGFGSLTVIVSAFIVSVFPVVASTLLGLESTDPALEDFFRLYGADHSQRMLKLKIPGALPQIFSGLKIASGLAVIGAIVGEFIAGSGLGEIVDVARTQQRIDKVFAAVLLSSFLGLTMVALINFSSWLALRKWHFSTRHR